MTRTAFDELVRHAPGATSDIDHLFPDLSARPVKRRIHRPAILIAAVAAVTATVLVVPMMLPGGTASAAALDTLSAAAGRQPEKAPDGIYHRVFVERFQYQGNIIHESWTLPDGTTWRRDTHPDGSVDYMKLPPMYSPTWTEWAPATVAALPTDAASMDAAVRKLVSGSISTNTAVFLYYGDALRVGYVPPAVRRAMILAMKRLPFIKAQTATTFDGAACMQITYYEPLEFFGGHYYCFDESTSTLLEEGRTFFGSVSYRSTLTVSDYVSTVPATVVSQAIDYTVPSGGPSETPSPTATPS
jgi:hypothetical protein